MDAKEDRMTDWDHEPTSSEEMYRWRTTRRKGGRMVYAQVGPDPSDADVPVGFMRSPELAEAVVWAHNVMHAAREQRALGVGLHDGCVAQPIGPLPATNCAGCRDEIDRSLQPWPVIREAR